MTHAAAKNGNPGKVARKSIVYLAGSFRNCTADGTFRSDERNQPTDIAILCYRKKVDNLTAPCSLCTSRKFYVVHKWMNVRSGCMSSGYAVLVEKVGLFLEKVGLFWKKPYFFSDCQVLVV